MHKMLLSDGSTVQLAGGAMVNWHGAVAWVLQGIGAIGAIWALYSSETSRTDETTGNRRLTGRGWFALLGVALGFCGFALNQYKSSKDAAEAAELRQEEAKRADDILENTKLQLVLTTEEVKLEKLRADAVQAQLNLVNASQDKIATSQSGLISSQRTQIDYLSGLAMVQQNLSGLELSWPDESILSNNMAQRINFTVKELELSFKGDDVYFENCLVHGELLMTRRPNYTWQVSCKLARPQGFLPLVYEISVGDVRARLLDAFFDQLLSPNLIIQNSKGDTLLVSNVGSRPDQVQRAAGIYTIVHELPRTRFNTLINRDISIRMDVQNTRGLPSSIRIKSRDPLAQFEAQFRPKWQMTPVGSQLVKRDIAGDFEEIDIMAAIAHVDGLRVSFDKLLTPGLKPREPLARR